ncbi:MAG: hypothetical protein ABSB35_16010 [Bryobacteraceae bacterium]
MLQLEDEPFIVERSWPENGIGGTEEQGALSLAGVWNRLCDGMKTSQGGTRQLQVFLSDHFPAGTPPQFVEEAALRTALSRVAAVRDGPTGGVFHQYYAPRGNTHGISATLLRAAASLSYSAAGR